jgi:hypothetical protein
MEIAPALAASIRIVAPQDSYARDAAFEGSQHSAISRELEALRLIDDPMRHHPMRQRLEIRATGSHPYG